MHITKSKIAFASLIAAASALAGVAAAQSPERMSDVAFIAASRCEGLAQGAKVDTAAIAKLLNTQDNDRQDYIRDKAEQARADGKRQASHTDGYAQEQVKAELGGSCKAYLQS